jgi:hypothetical protein
MFQNPLFAFGNLRNLPFERAGDSLLQLCHEQEIPWHGQQGPRRKVVREHSYPLERFATYASAFLLLIHRPENIKPALQDVCREWDGITRITVVCTRLEITADKEILTGLCDGLRGIFRACVVQVTVDEKRYFPWIVDGRPKSVRPVPLKVSLVFGEPLSV